MDNDNNENFNAQVIKALEVKTNWYNAVGLPRMQDAYRLHLSFIRNLFEILVNRSLILPDPYKADSKVSSIICPETEPFNDTERSVQIGIRLSAYESNIDHVCNYMRFTMEHLNAENLKKLAELNATFGWENLSINSSRANTHALAAILSDLRKGGANMAVNMLTDSIGKNGDCMVKINRNLQELIEFDRELYKGAVRKNILTDSSFDWNKASSSEEFLGEIKRLFPSCMKNQQFVNNLIDEIVQEETASNKQSVQERLLTKLQVVDEENERKNEEIDTHVLLMDVIKAIGSTSEQYSSVIGKVSYNHDILETSKNNFKQKVLQFIRNILGMDPPKAVYELSISERAGEKRTELLPYKEFMESLVKRSKYYSTIVNTNSPNYIRINSQPEKIVSGFVDTQIRENGRLQVVLSSLDEYFKASVAPSDRSKMKGIKMELMTLKNVLMKAKRQKTEYDAYIEEDEKKRQLGLKK